MLSIEVFGIVSSIEAVDSVGAAGGHFELVPRLWIRATWDWPVGNVGNVGNVAAVRCMQPKATFPEIGSSS
jgi:hypothetical protein